MNKKFNKAVASVLAGLFFTLFGTKAVKAQEAEYTQAISPQPDFQLVSPAIKGDDTGLVWWGDSGPPDTGKISKKPSQSAELEYSSYYYSYHLANNSPEPEEDEYFFIAVLSKPQKEVVCFSKMEFVQTPSFRGLAEFTIPSYVDSFEVHLYKQKKDEPDFTLRSENFLSKTKFCTPTINYFYTYGTEEENRIPILDKNGNILESLTRRQNNSLVRYTPNFYSFQNHRVDEGDDNIIDVRRYIFVIKLPEDKQDLIAEDDRIMCANGYEWIEGVNVQTYGVTSIDDRFVNFYIPDEIDEFEVWCYRLNITDENFKWKCKIKLNRVY